MPVGYRKVSDLPELIPVFPLDGALLLPGCQLPLQIFEPRYLNMIDDAMSGHRLIGMIQTSAGGERVRPHLADVGCAGRITSYAETGDGRYIITLTGVCRFEAGDELDIATPYRQVRPSYQRFASDLDADEAPLALERAPFLATLRRYLEHKGLAVEWDAAKQAPAGALINSLAMGLPLDPAEKQALLEAPTLAERKEVLTALMEIDAAADDDEPPPLQ
jgi:Lon protease-like protein